MVTSVSRALALDSATFFSLSISIIKFERSVSRVLIFSLRFFSVCKSSPLMPLILSTMFLMLTVSSILVSASRVALNLALHSGHSNIPMRVLVSSPLAGFLTENGQVLIGVVTSAPHFGHFTKV